MKSNCIFTYDSGIESLTVLLFLDSVLGLTRVIVDFIGAGDRHREGGFLPRQLHNQCFHLDVIFQKGVVYGQTAGGRSTEDLKGPSHDCQAQHGDLRGGDRH